MFSYYAYGLGIHSALPLPEFVSQESGCDVTILLEKADPSVYVPLEVADQSLYCKIATEEAILYSKNLGVFLVRGGREIVVIPVPDVEDRLIRLYIVGTIMAILLYQRGLLVLHASVVDIDGSAVAILGQSGAGKSSTAAALHAHGHNIIADDVCAVSLDTPTPTVFPGFPQIKLSLEAAATLGYDIESLHLLHSQEKRRAYRVTQGFSHNPLPLKRLYALAEDTALRIKPLGFQETVMQLVLNSRPTTLFHSGGAAHFLQCTKLAKQLTIHRLERPRSLSSLPDLAQLIEKHVVRDLQQVVA